MTVAGALAEGNHGAGKLVARSHRGLNELAVGWIEMEITYRLVATVLNFDTFFDKRVEEGRQRLGCEIPRGIFHATFIGFLMSS